MRSRPTDSASMRARRDATCRSAPRSADCSSATRSSASRSAVTVRSWCSSRPTSPASSSPTRLWTVSNSRLRLLRAGRGLVDADRQPRDGLVDGLDAGAHGVHLTGQPGQAFATVGLGPGRGQVGAFGFGGEPFALGQFGAGGLQSAPRLAPARRAAACSCAAISSASASSASGSAPARQLRSASSSCARSVAMRTVALTRSASADSRNQRLLRGFGPLGEGRRPPTRGLQLDGRGVEPAGQSRRARGAASSRPGWCR